MIGSDGLEAAHRKLNEIVTIGVLVVVGGGNNY